MKTYEVKFQVSVCEMNELTDADRHLVELAMQATDHSYAPYSQFRVGAAVRLADGTELTGSNQENAAYPSGLCAERTTLFHAQHLRPDQPVAAIAIAARNHRGFLSLPIPPCGACRQVMLEIENRYSHPMRILLHSTTGIHIIPSVRSLLPLQFTSDTME